MNWFRSIAGVVAVFVATPSLASVESMIRTEVRRTIGEKWVDVALYIAKKESGMRCDAVGPRTRHGRALGVFQVMPSTARKMGFDPRRLRECHVGVRAGVNHMKMCISHGVNNANAMKRCHVHGVGGWKRVSRNPY